ncbi:MAG: hypothetical protein RLZZ568_1274 [Cyanobacteriota bacterium]|jgi:hypothetical protein
MIEHAKTDQSERGGNLHDNRLLAIAMTLVFLFGQSI